MISKISLVANGTKIKHHVNVVNVLKDKHKQRKLPVYTGVSSIKLKSRLYAVIPSWILKSRKFTWAPLVRKSFLSEFRIYIIPLVLWYLYTNCDVIFNPLEKVYFILYVWRSYKFRIHHFKTSDRILLFNFLFYYREGINLALVKLKKDGIVTKLWRKWLLNRKPDCDHVKDEVMW